MDRCAGELARAHLSKLFLPVVLVVSNLKTHGEKRICAPGPPHEPISIPNWKLATLALATFPHWQHFRPARWGERTRLRALRVAFGNVPSEASPLRCMSSASRRLVFTSPMTSSLALLYQSYCVNRVPVPPSRFLATLAHYPRSHSRAVSTLIVTPSSEIVSWSWSVISSKSLQPVFFATLQQTLS